MLALLLRPYFYKKYLSESFFLTSEQEKYFLRYTQTSISIQPGILRKLKVKFSFTLILILIGLLIYSFSFGFSLSFSGSLTANFALKAFSDFASIFSQY